MRQKSRNRRSIRNRAGRPLRKPGCHGLRVSERPQPVNLHQVDETSLGKMLPGDIILVTESDSLKHAVAAMFYALLACPVCGAVGLITSGQYAGDSPVTCAADLCSCRFRIDDKNRLTFLPVH